MVQERGLKAIWNLTAKSLPVSYLPFGMQVNLDKEGRLYFIDHASKKNVYEPPNPTACSKMNTVSFQQMGGINAILSAMYKFPNSAKIQEAGCAIIRNIIAYDSQLSIPVCQLMGCQTILHSFKVHRANKDVILTASHAINNIALHEPHRDFLGSLGVIPVLVDLMNLYSNDAKTLGGIAGAMWEIAVPNGNQVLLLQHGAVAMCCNMLRTWVSDSSVQSKCIGVLWNLTVSKAGEQEVVRNGGLQLMISAMERFPEVTNIHEPALGAFWNMIVHDASATNTIKKHKRLIQQSQARFPNSTRVQEKAGKILPRL